uniref:Fibronectin type-III domain-containing protein n=1 Tax=Hemiselmis andersenii TaxID=464988 RepID=A0A6T8P5J7_HEMAN|mmetsp:Transcript_41209/g.95619  ORF Transcript_41209/g.95619 Transcript_41209/m.95619 type:complete len:566 (+) Transcript_41209:70-1767(+)
MGGGAARSLAVVLVAALVGGCFSISYDGHISIPNTKGGLFGAVAYGDEGWFGVDGYPSEIVRIKLGNRLSSALSETHGPIYAYSEPGERLGGEMQVTGRLSLLPSEERLWCIVPEPRDLSKPHWYAYVGVGAPSGRLVKVDLLGMKRVGYVDLTSKDVRAGVVLGGSAYFATSSRPATVMRCPVEAMFHGDTFRPVEVTLALGEHNVQTMFVDHTGTHVVMGTYTQPARIVRLATPSMKRSASLTLSSDDEMIYSGALWDRSGVFVTSTLPGRLLRVQIEPMKHTGTIVFSRGEDRAVSVVVFGGSAYVGFANDWEQKTSSIVQVDLATMREVGALVTPPGASWLYTGVSSGGFAFFGSRYHDTSRVVRVAMVTARPDVPKPPEGNATGQDAVRLSWRRPFETYHTGGAAVIGARLLLRPAWHWDWTEEHVYGAAAPDPAAPSSGIGRIVRYHEDPAELLDGGYGCVVTGLDAMERYKFAVIVTNSAGPSHRSRSGEAIGTSFSAKLELVLLGAAILIDTALMGHYLAAMLSVNGKCKRGFELASSFLLCVCLEFCACVCVCVCV